MHWPFIEHASSFKAKNSSRQHNVKEGQQNGKCFSALQREFDWQGAILENCPSKYLQKMTAVSYITKKQYLNCDDDDY